MRKPFRLLLILLAGAMPLAAQQPLPAQMETGVPFRTLPFHEVAEMVAGRYAGRMVAAQTDAPRPPERALGAGLIYEFRLVTPQRNLLIIRVDAGNGRFLEVAGHGQLLAQRGAGQRPGGVTSPVAGSDEDKDED